MYELAFLVVETAAENMTYAIYGADLLLTNSKSFLLTRQNTQVKKRRQLFQDTLAHAISEKQCT